LFKIILLPFSDSRISGKSAASRTFSGRRTSHKLAAQPRQNRFTPACPNESSFIADDSLPVKEPTLSVGFLRQDFSDPQRKIKFRFFLVR
jgi:hypothetical protein